MNCCDAPHALEFKLSLLAIAASFLLALAGLIPPFKDMLIPFPLPWLVAILVLIPGLMLYYSVKEEFWAEVMKAAKNKPK